MDTPELQNSLAHLFEALVEARNEDDDAALAAIVCDAITDMDLREVATFERAQLLTRDAGLVLRMSDGSEFQLTIVRSR